jgi:hypothetical protein
MSTASRRPKTFMTIVFSTVIFGLILLLGTFFLFKDWSWSRKLQFVGVSVVLNTIINTILFSISKRTATR